jgi:hypothetical protein
LSERSLADSQTAMGYGTTRALDRVLAACGMLASAGLEFVAADDVPQGGVLLALPALLTEGLLRHTLPLYSLPPGFYPLESLFLYLALLALTRCPSLEQTRYEAPGEWGKLLGLDRMPEVKTLRAKISRKIPLQEAPEAERLRQLRPESKHFIDTVKMIAYRAESALAGEAREHQVVAARDDAQPGGEDGGVVATGKPIKAPAEIASMIAENRVELREVLLSQEGAKKPNETTPRPAAPTKRLDSLPDGRPFAVG